MANNLKGTKTEKNLMDAFAGESMARNKYDFYASQAKKDASEQVAAFFAETALNEKEHAKLWFKLLHDGVPGTAENLADAAGGEHFEWVDMYAKFEKEAREEGFSDIAVLFKGVGAIEKTHEERYLKLLETLNTGKTFQKDEPIVWVCRNCGHIHTGKTAPGLCPVCKHPQMYFEEKQDNY